MGIAAVPAQQEPRSAPEGAATGAVPVAAGAEAATKQSRSVAANSTKSTASENANHGFVTFDQGRKHLARVIAVNGKKVTVRFFNKKTGEWQTKNESREREACIPLTAAEAEVHFPSSVAAWDKAAIPPNGSGGKVTRQMSPNLAPPLADNAGYGVTTSSAQKGAPTGCVLIAELESYIRSYVRLAESSYALVIAMWLVATHVWTVFDAFPYLVVTSVTKRSGKTRLLELISFMASNPRSVVNISPAALYRTISADKPTLLIDEAEMFSSAKSEFRSLLNSGYRRGQTVKRHDGDYETYCPKAFALIGDVHDTLRDRSIVIEMKRGEAASRFVYAAAQEEGAALRETISAAVSLKAEEITEALRSFGGLSFLTDRDEEIWTPLFALCRLICPDRIEELTRAAADLSAAKTAKARRYSELSDEEDGAQEQEYAVWLLHDMLRVIGDQKQITTQEAITKLRQIPTSPWRRFRGDGLKDGIEGAMVVAGLLSRLGVKPTTIRIAAKNVGTGSTAKGYRRQALVEALGRTEHHTHNDKGILSLLPVLNDPPQGCGGCDKMHFGIAEFRKQNPHLSDEQAADTCGVGLATVRQAKYRFPTGDSRVGGEQNG
ncbi:MAG TPA: DUF3631 domain-containing protein [Candidatus Acidoferrales bacterium]|nr:DUF3631 domain-containing protein [Candidatus Acidoferrales bacterium]